MTGSAERIRSTTDACTERMQELIGSIRAAVRGEPDPGSVAARVAESLRPHLTRPDLLAPEQCRSDEDGYCQHVLHVEPDGSFSVVALVWLEGQSTPIHDHVSWCVPGVHRGREEEIRYRRVDGSEHDGQDRLEKTGTVVNDTGGVCALTPPGDIHRVENPGPGTAISIHVYGANIAELGSSIRRTYELPVREAVR